MIAKSFKKCILSAVNTIILNNVVRPIGYTSSALTLATVLFIFPLMAQAQIAGDFDKSLSPNMHMPSTQQAQTKTVVPASVAAGVTRTLPHGVFPAASNVKTNCFSPHMLSLLSAIQNKYGRAVIITSGFRSATHNVSVGGVKNSTHTACAAADIKVPGISKYELARFVRSLPNRGGVGLYCHNAVHVDIGQARDWNWCKKRKRK